MKQITILGVLLASVLVGVQAQEYVLAWDHPGADHYRVTAEGSASVNVTETRWTIPEALRTARSFMVEACNALNVCSVGATLPNLPPAPPLNLQIGVIGNGIPTTDGPPQTVVLPTNLTSLSPVNGATGVATNVTITCEATDATTYTLLFDTVNPPVAAHEASPSAACSFLQIAALEESTTYYYKVTASNDAGSISSDVTSFATVTPQTDDLLTTGITVTNTGWVTKGLVLPEGVATGGVQAVGPSGSVTTQTNVRTTWDDGSIRFAQVTFDATETGVFNFVDASADAGTTAEGTADVDVEIAYYPLVGTNLTPQNYTLSMPDTCTDGTFTNGSLMSECRSVVAPTGATDEFQYFRIYFEKRTYSDGTVSVHPTFNNTKRIETVNATGALVYTANIKVDGVSVYTFNSAPTAGPCAFSSTAGGVITTSCTHGVPRGNWIVISDTASANYKKFGRLLVETATTAATYSNPLGSNTSETDWVYVPKIHGNGARWRPPSALAIDGFDAAAWEEDLSSLFAAKAYPTYLPEVVSTVTTMSGAGTRVFRVTGGSNAAVEATGNEENYAWEPLAIADHSPYVQGGGGRDEIGLTPGTYARFLAHPDSQGLRANVLRIGDLGGTWQWHFTHPTDENMVDFVDEPNMTAVGATAATLMRGGAPNGGYISETGPAHKGSYSHLPYLLTGDRYYLEGMKHEAQWAIGSYLSGRQGAQGRVQLWQVRMGAWAMRDMVNAANYLPDDDSHKTYFHTLVQNNLTWYDEYVLTQEALDPVVKQYRGSQRDGQCGVDTGVSGLAHFCTGLFMNSYLALSLQHVIRQGGFTGGENTRNYLADEMIQFYADANWQIHAGVYHHKSRFASTGDPFASLEEMYNYNFTTVSPGTNPPRITDPNHVNPGRSGDYRAAILVGQAAGRPNADDAMNYLMSWPTVMEHLTESSYITGYSGSQMGFANID